ncbi:proline-specific peptidase [Phellopilus nigrolimitatus]|nr:proline-specific peptidase [Phellopilus nigrolimitatus]
MSSVKTTEGMAPFQVQGETYSTWYKVVGDLSSGHRPLVVLHGGPGTSHDYMIPLADLSSLNPSTPVIFYDQIGTARSVHPDLSSKDQSFWTIDLFIAELENLLMHFNIVDSFDLMGHSWGGIVAAEFAVRRQSAGLRHLILADTSSSSKLRSEASTELRKALPMDVQETIREHEEAGTTDTPEYKQAMFVFHEKYTCRIKPLPKEFMYSLKQTEQEGGIVLKAILKNVLKENWDIRDRAHLIRAPTLIINGEYDYMTDAVVSPYFRGIEKVKWVKFALSSHMPHWEERERYIGVVNSFLRDE